MDVRGIFNSQAHVSQKLRWLCACHRASLRPYIRGGGNGGTVPPPLPAYTPEVPLFTHEKCPFSNLFKPVQCPLFLLTRVSFLFINKCPFTVSFFASDRSPFLNSVLPRALLSYYTVQQFREKNEKFESGINVPLTIFKTN